MGEKWTDNTLQWLERKAKAKVKAKSKKASVNRKFDKLSAEKKMIDKLFKENEMKYA